MPSRERGRNNLPDRLGGLLLVLLVCSWPAGAQLGNTPPNTGGNCAACHIESMDSFKEPAGVLLIEAPGKAVVADSDTCLGCHDGSVADSRRIVWLEHGHRTGIKPSAGMTVPKEFPLDKGKLACRTCHTAHVAGFTESPKDAIFLRMRNEQDQMCKTCHADKSRGPETGSHSLGKMKSAFPPALASAGAHSGPQRDLVLCQSCHGAHGSGDDKLLLMATSASELCLTCHADLRPAMWDKNPAHSHPANLPIHKPGQLQAIKDMGTVLGTGNTLVCLSCHKMHNGQAGKAILADTLRDSAMCLRCHENLKPMLGGKHDLRKSAPKELNVLSESSEQSGPCAACHTFHSFRRKLTPGATDPQGVCITCHSEGQIAATHGAGKLFHPVALPQDRIPTTNTLPLESSARETGKKTLACLSCHDPHDTRHPQFLRASSEQVCSTCHAEFAKSLAKPHDFTEETEFKNALGATPAQAGRCGFCHSVHEAKGPMMLAATGQPLKTMDDACVQCHSPNGMANEKSHAKYNHVSGPDVKLKTAIAGLTLPLFDAQFHPAANGSVACSSCHNVHAGEKQSKWLLRSTSPTQLCVQCHPAQAPMAGGAHDLKTSKKPFPAQAIKSNDLCLSCHRAHGNDAAKQLWTVPPAAGQIAADGACVACHADQAWSSAARADRKGLMLHPQPVPATSLIAKLKHALPLAAGSPANLTCGTCHDPHATPKTAALLRIPADRPATEICARCHAEAAHLEMSAHNRQELNAQTAQSTACAPCHRVHASAGMERKALWATRTFANGANEPERLCLGCHSKDGGAKVPAVYSHPETNLKDIKQTTTRPAGLVDQFGKINQITCATCHLPHGRDVPGATAAALDRAEITGAKTVLRPHVDRQVCAPCHGIDAARMYLYFHNPAKRAAVKELDETP